MLSVNTNQSSLSSRNQLLKSHRSIQVRMQRLSSGLRVNGAKDDAAGLSISTRMDAQSRGLAVARRNATDGISFTQTAEGALSEVVNGLQRIRELAVQAANGTNNDADRAAIQGEVDAIKAELDRINSTTNFNGEQIFNQSNYAAAADEENKRELLTGMRSYWLREAEDRISSFYGIQGDGREVSIDIGQIDGVANTLARVNLVSGDLSMDIDGSDFQPANLPDGTNNTINAERVIAHEVVHLVQFANGMSGVNHWFLEGTAEFLIGADDRMVNELGGVATAANDVALEDNFTAPANPNEYSRAYAAVRYMHQRIKDNGGSGIDAVFAQLASNGGNLDAALANGSSGAFSSEANFKTQWAGADGEAFLGTMDLTNDDNGAIGGFDADGGEVLDENTVFANKSTLGKDPLQHFKTTFDDVLDPTRKQGGKVTNLHIGADGEQLSFHLGAFGSNALGLRFVDVSEDAHKAIAYVDDALTYVNGFRSNLGALQNRLESSVTTLAVQEEAARVSRSRIPDADFAAETGALSRTQIIQQASVSMLAQANTSPQLALSLL